MDQQNTNVPKNIDAELEPPVKEISAEFETPVEETSIEIQVVKPTKKCKSFKYKCL